MEDKYASYFKNVGEFCVNKKNKKEENRLTPFVLPIVYKHCNYYKRENRSLVHSIKLINHAGSIPQEVHTFLKIFSECLELTNDTFQLSLIMYKRNAHRFRHQYHKIVIAITMLFMSAKIEERDYQDIADYVERVHVYHYTNEADIIDLERRIMIDSRGRIYK
uniref:Uncharacterized protein n=1 Tax=viral metagenome TaxID=1070528 RepID=A0A6C0CTC4_9ZZZZ